MNIGFVPSCPAEDGKTTYSVPWALWLQCTQLSLDPSKAGKTPHFCPSPGSQGKMGSDRHSLL